jgi:hypothetical protein
MFTYPFTVFSKKVEGGFRVFRIEEPRRVSSFQEPGTRSIMRILCSRKLETHNGSEFLSIEPETDTLYHSEFYS